MALHRFSHVTYLPLFLQDFTQAGAPRPARSRNVFSPSIVSFVAWGAPPEEDGQSAVSAGLWAPETYVETLQIPGGDGMLPGGSLALQVRPATGSPSDWAIYRPGEASRAGSNPPPAPYFRNPSQGIATCDRRLTFGWSTVEGALLYRLEIDDSANFASPLIAVDLLRSTYRPASDLPLGTLYYRVRVTRADSRLSAYSDPGNVTIMDCVAQAGDSGSLAQVLLNVNPILQHKDTRMLNLDGDKETGQGRWDSAHEDDGDWTVGNGTPVRASAIDNMYCSRASIAMLVAYHGGSLSQDRISFFYRGEGEPEGDLGHGKGMWPNGNLTAGTGKKAFDWAMDDNAVTSSRGKPTFVQVKGWIDAGRPMLIVENNDRHSVVLDGYRDAGQQVHRVDPWTATGSWVSLSTWSISEYHVPPTGVTPRSDEDVDADGIRDTIDDSDGDGVVDFDELNRFRGRLRHLNPNKADSDGDLVPDKLDMRSYLFNDAGDYSRRRPDWDFDGSRKEVDPDNDNYWDIGSNDGCEDTNRNGRLDGEETSNFDPSEDQEKDCNGPVVAVTGPNPGSIFDQCVVNVAGLIASDVPLTSVDALITSGAQSNTVSLAWSGSEPDFEFNQRVPLFRGDNAILVTAVNGFGSGNDFTTVRCNAPPVDIHVQLSWPQRGSDFDLHLIRPGGSYWSIPDDCHWRNRSPDWGVAGDPSDNPALDVDCITGCTLENIILSNPETGSFSVKVHYYSDHRLGPSSPTVRIWVNGQERVFGPRHMTSGQVWDVATVEWPAGTVSAGAGVLAGPEVQLPAKAGD